jgi:peptide/nickel transport system permease protein
MQEIPITPYSKSSLWKRFRKQTAAYYAMWFLLVFVAIALLAPFIANDQPLYIQLNGNSYYPALSWSNSITLINESGQGEVYQKEIVDWKHLNYEAVVWCPIPYDPNSSDLLNADYVSPSGAQLFKNKEGAVVEMPTRFRHLLGTNKRGEDVLSGLINGFRVALSIGILAMCIAAFIGLLLGAAAGYFGDNNLTTNRGLLFCSPLLLVLAFFYGFQTRSGILAEALSISIFYFIGQLLLSLGIAILLFVLLAWMVRHTIGRLPWLNQKTAIPLDSIVSRVIEIVISLPTLILIITIAAIMKASIWNIIVLIGMVQWTSIARFTRAEFLKIKSLDYIQAAHVLGYSDSRILVKHILPNAIAPALVSIAFGIAGAILTESGLSFLGIGLAADQVTWGTLMNSGRENFNAWWLVVFPGVFIFLTVLFYNLIGEGLRDALDPKMQN